MNSQTSRRSPSIQNRISTGMGCVSFVTVEIVEVSIHDNKGPNLRESAARLVDIGMVVDISGRFFFNDRLLGTVQHFNNTRTVIGAGSPETVRSTVLAVFL